MGIDFKIEIKSYIVDYFGDIDVVISCELVIFGTIDLLIP